MDEIDRGIIGLLRKDARLSNVFLAGKLGISEGAVRHRIARMLKTGVIKNFTINTRSCTMAVIGIKTNSPSSTESISREIKKIGATIVAEVAGSFDIICLVQGDSLPEINELVDKIRAFRGVSETVTYPVLKEYD